MGFFIKQLKENEKIYSSLLEVDDIKSANNLSRLVDCELSKTDPKIFNNMKKYYFSPNNNDNDSYGKSIFNFNVFPKKDKKGRQHPINTSYSFNFNSVNDSFLGIYELTTINFSESINNNAEFEYNDIHFNEFLFSRRIGQVFNYQRESFLNERKKLDRYNLKKNAEYIKDLKYRGIKAGLMLPDRNTEIELEKLYNGPESHEYNRVRFNDFIQYNKSLYKILQSRNDFKLTLKDIIEIIVDAVEIEQDSLDEEIIILDFGCKNISDMEYEPLNFKKPMGKTTSTIKLDEPLSKDIGPIIVPTKSKYKYQRLLTEIGK